MNGDLESTLNELGPEYRDVVARLRSARDVEPSTKHQWRSHESTSDAVAKAPGTFFRRVGYLVAASLAVALGLSIFMQDAANAPREPYAGVKVYTVAYAPTEEALEVIVASQRADGSWSNDFITRQNAAALRASDDARMKIAYRRAVRYLRSKGLSPLTDDELKVRGEYAAKVLAGV
ncbi:MAG: hypothetical protein K6G94_07240 [Kiritimatiellae bacterium]|nr:hypothetical protein [Kiritimatiellia bacterium]